MPTSFASRGRAVRSVFQHPARIARVLLAAVALLTACAEFPLFPSGRLVIVKPHLAGGIADGFPDGYPSDPVAAAVFDRINADRREAGLPPVRWDPKAAALADDYTREQIRQGTFGHFLLDGIPPYARLSHRGDLGVGAENVVAYVSSDDRIDESPLTLALRGEDSMMSETPPKDGHRRAILDPGATHVGVGWSLIGGNFRMAEEFTSRRYDWLRVSQLGAEGSSIRVRGHALPGMSIAFVSVALQPVPATLSLQEVNARHSYAYPDPRYALLPATSSFSAVGLMNLRCLTPSVRGRFSFNYQIDQPGLWTFILYFDRKGTRAPAAGGSFTVWVAEENAPSVRS